MKPFAKHLTRTKPMWLYIENGKVTGPVSQEKMSRLIEEGRVSRSSKIAKQQTDDWYAIGETGFEKEISLSESQPVPRQARPLLIGGVAVGCIGLPLAVWSALWGFVLLGAGLSFGSLGLSLRRGAETHTIFR